MQRTKRTEGVNGMRDAGMKQVDIARAFNVSRIVTSRLLMKHRETGSVKESKWSTLILECKGLLLKRYGMGTCMWYVFLRPHAAVKSSKEDFEFSKVPEQNSGI